MYVRSVGEQPAVSVVIPTYERPDVLRRAIDSVRRQTWTDWEAIVVDDCSSADIAAVVDGIGDARVRVVRRAVNGGVAAAQNTGLDEASGRYVSFLHSDDEWAPQRLAAMVPLLDSSPSDVGGVECGALVIEPSGAHRVNGPWLLGATDADLLAYRAGVHISSLLLRRELALATRFDEELRHTEDRDFSIRLLRRTRLVFDARQLVVVHREVPGLRDRDKAPTCEYLIEKYQPELRGHPRLQAIWWSRLARLAARAGDRTTARAAMRRAVGARPGRARWWPLLAAAHLPGPACSQSFAAYLAVARARTRLRRHAPPVAASGE